MDQATPSLVIVYKQPTMWSTIRMAAKGKPLFQNFQDDIAVIGNGLVMIR